MANSKQLYEHKNGEFQELFPFIRIGDIKDEEGKRLLSLINKFNHIYLGTFSNKNDARLIVPSLFRRYGIWVSYNYNGDFYTEKYIGPNINIEDDNIWIDNNNWEIVPDVNYVNNASLRIPANSITLEQLSKSVIDLLANGNTIINLADDEDLQENECHVIKFKDRKYSPILASGKGYKILRKNWINGKNVLTQDMINEPNTIYEIRYDFDLNEQEITIPEGCILDFQGGSFNNGIITSTNGNVCNLVNESNNTIFNDIIIKTASTYCNWKINCIANTDWFSCDDDILLYNLSVFNGAILNKDLNCTVRSNSVVKGYYTLVTKHSFILDGNNHTINYDMSQTDDYVLFSIIGDYGIIKNIIVKPTNKDTNNVSSYSIIGQNTALFTITDSIIYSVNRVVTTNNSIGELIIKNSKLYSTSFIIEQIPAKLKITNSSLRVYDKSKTFRGDIISHGRYDAIELMEITDSFIQGGIEINPCNNLIVTNCILPAPSFGARTSLIDEQYISEQATFRNCNFIGWEKGLYDSNKPYNIIKWVKNVFFDNCVFDIKCYNSNYEYNLISINKVESVEYRDCIIIFDKTNKGHYDLLVEDCKTFIMNNCILGSDNVGSSTSVKGIIYFNDVDKNNHTEVQSNVYSIAKNVSVNRNNKEGDSNVYGFDPTIYNKLFRSKSEHGTTANRIKLSEDFVGTPYFDTTLGKPIWWNNGKWVDATGTEV